MSKISKTEMNVNLLTLSEKIQECATGNKVNDYTDYSGPKVHEQFGADNPLDGATTLAYSQILRDCMKGHRLRQMNLNKATEFFLQWLGKRVPGMVQNQKQRDQLFIVGIVPYAFAMTHPSEANKQKKLKLIEAFGTALLQNEPDFGCKAVLVHGESPSDPVMLGLIIIKFQAELEQ